MSRDHLILNQSGRYHFKELELLILNHLKSTGHVQPGLVAPVSTDKIHIGNMIIDLILLTENLQLDFTECLAAAYVAQTGDKK
jgi:hypothetical protein